MSAMIPFFELSAFVVKIFVGGLWQGTVFLGAVSCCLRFLRRTHASIRFTVCGLAFLLVLLVPLLDASEFKPGSAYSAPHVLRFSFRFGLALTVTWLLLSLWRSIELLKQGRALVGLWRRAAPLDLASYGLESAGEIGRNVEICTSTEVEAPSIIGFFKPRLLIPAWMLGKLTATDLQHVAMHELEHLRRYDDWMNLLQKIALVFFPLNPALLWFDKRLGLERELACDDRVAEMSATPFEYARCLIRLTEFRAARRRFELILHAWERRSELAYRIHALVAPVRRISSEEARAAATFFSLSLLGMSVAFWRVPSLVSVEGVAISEPPTMAAVTVPDGHLKSPLLTHASFVPRQHPEVLRASLPGGSVKRHSQVGLVTASEPVNFVLANGVAASRKQRCHLEYAVAKRGVVDTTAHEANDAAAPAEVLFQLMYTPTYAAVPLSHGWLIIQL